MCTALADAIDGGVLGATAQASGSMSTPHTSAAPSFAAAMARMPEPVPRSSTRARGVARQRALEQDEQPRVLA